MRALLENHSELSVQFWLPGSQEAEVQATALLPSPATGAPRSLLNSLSHFWDFGGSKYSVCNFEELKAQLLKLYQRGDRVLFASIAHSLSENISLKDKSERKAMDTVKMSYPYELNIGWLKLS